MGQSVCPDENPAGGHYKKERLNVGIISGRIASIYVLNQESDDDYINGRWEYTNLPYCQAIHRLCVNPVSRIWESWGTMSYI